MAANEENRHKHVISLSEKFRRLEDALESIRTEVNGAPVTVGYDSEHDEHEPHTLEGEDRWERVKRIFESQERGVRHVRINVDGKYFEWSPHAE